MIVVSQFRTGYWIAQAISAVAGLALVGLCFYFALRQAKPDHLFLFISCFLALIFVLSTRNLLVNEIKQLTVSGNGIAVKYPVTKIPAFVRYDDILKFTTRRIKNFRGAGTTTGHYALTIHLKNERTLTFDEDQYENYNEVKALIYRYWKELHELDIPE